MKTILVVDDNKEIRDEIGDIFKMENFNVIEAKNGQVGFSMAMENVPDIIISDILMPIMDGFQMFKKLKNNPKTDTIPVIFLSALTGQKDIRIGMNLGADDYLTKPIIPDFLIKAVKNKIAKYAKIVHKMEHLKINLTEILHHELRTPLNGIIGFSDFLSESISNLNKEEITEYVQHIKNSGVRLYRLIEKYLKFAELKINSMNESFVYEYSKTPYLSTKDTILRKVDHYTNIYQRKNDLRLEWTNTEVKMDEVLFETLMDELIENAFKFSRKGDKILINSDVNKNRFKIRIYNEGIGMKQDEIDTISDFNQYNRRQFAQNGSGIGLSIVKLISDIYGIEFNIISEYKSYFSATLIIREIFRLKHADEL